jgi:hypothetical protein
MPIDPAQRHQIKQDPTMPKLSETQIILLSAGAQRPDNIALPLPKGLHGAAAKRAVTKMMMRGWLQEIDANLRQGEPLWRETGDGHGTTLVVTDAGLLAIGVEPVVVKTIVTISKYASVTPEAKQPTQRVWDQAGDVDRAASSPRRRHDGGDCRCNRLAGTLCRCPDYADVVLQAIVFTRTRCEGVGIIR